MRSGTLRDNITLLTPEYSDDARFGQQTGWNAFATVWANVTPVDGTETVENQGVQTEITHTITMRYRCDVSATDRIEYRNQLLEIVSVIDPTGKRRELMIHAKLYVGVS